MDCCTTYNDYRPPIGLNGIGGGSGAGGINGSGGGGSGVYNSSYYPPANGVKYPPQGMPMFRNGGGMYNEFDRLGSYQNPPYNYNIGSGGGGSSGINGYLRDGYGYHHHHHHNHHHQPHHPLHPSHHHYQNGGGYYSPYHPYDSYRYSYHHKDSYSPTDGIYVNGRTGYPYPPHLPLPPTSPIPHDPYQSSPTMFNEIGAPQTPPATNHTNNNNNHHQHQSPGSTYSSGDYNMPSPSTTPYSNSGSGSGGGGPNNLTPTISNATGAHFNKEPRPKKSRDKEKSGLMSGSNRKTPIDYPVGHDSLERCGTPYMNPHYTNYNDSPYNYHYGMPRTNQNWPVTPPPPQTWNPLAQQEWNPSHRSFRKSNPSANGQMPPPTNEKTKSTAKENSKNAGSAESETKPVKPRRKRNQPKHNSTESPVEQLNPEIRKTLTPLPGFQQAFGSTEIGRFSEVFFNISESPIEPNFESEADTLSPQPWEMGDSLEGPHFNLQVGASVHPSYYADNYASMDSPTNSISNSCYFREISCNQY